ncbi:MAG: hypothetical protein M1826_005250 [Phylliscum demangeonii]|nr:MAG: hypothetical protein M1826_005250 [Phylliscum demangeonii]
MTSKPEHNEQRTFSGEEISRNEDMTPIMISPQKNADGELGFAAVGIGKETTSDFDSPKSVRWALAVNGAFRPSPRSILGNQRSILKKTAVGGSRKGSVQTQDFLDEAEKVMEFIRAQGKPRIDDVGQGDLRSYDICTVQEADETHLGDDLESSPEAFLRPPSREGQTRARTTSPIAHAEQHLEATRRLRVYAESREVELGASQSLVLPRDLDRGLRITSKSDAGDKPAYVENEEMRIRIGMRSDEPTSGDKASSSGRSLTPREDAVDSMPRGTNSTGGSNSSRTVHTNSTGRSENKHIIPPQAVSHLIPGEVAGMTFDRGKQAWVKQKPILSDDPNAQMPGLVEESEDPLRDIPDLSVSESEELRKIGRPDHDRPAEQVLAAGSGRGGDHKKTDKPSTFGTANSAFLPHKCLDTQSEMENGETRAETKLSPSDLYGANLRRPGDRQRRLADHDAGLIPALDGKVLTSEGEAGGAKMQEDIDDVEHEIQADQGRIPENPGLFTHRQDRKRDVTVTFTSPALSRSIHFSGHGSVLHHATEADREPVSGEKTKVNRIFRLDGVHSVRSKRSRHTSAVFLKQASPRLPARHVSLTYRSRPRHQQSTIDNDGEEGAGTRDGYTTIPGKAGFNLAVLTPSHSQSVALKTRIIPTERRSFITFALSPLPDFTVNQPEETFGFETSYLPKDSNVRSAKSAKHALAITSNELVQKLTDLAPWEPFWDRIRKLNLSDRRLLSLQGLGAFCPKIERLDVSKNSIGQLTGIPPGLRHLRASHNSLSSLSTWGHLRNLQYLDVSYNRLDSLRGLSSLVHLRELKADNNRLSSLQGILQLDGLVKLDISHNFFRGLDFLGARLCQLSEVTARNNSIMEIVGLGVLPLLARLDLDNNKISAFSVQASGPLPSLRVLSINKNRIQLLDVGMMSQLRSLSADENILEGIQGLDAAEHLHSFSARGQMFSSPETRKDCSLLAGCVEMRKLRLSKNQLSSLNIASTFHNLHYLELAVAGLDCLPVDFGLRMPNVRVLNLNFNALKDITPLVGMRRLKKLYVTGNRLGRLRKVTHALARLPALEEVDLRNNPITLGFYPPSLQSRVMSRGANNEHRLRNLKSAREHSRLPATDPAEDGLYRKQLDVDTLLRRRSTMLIGQFAAVLLGPLLVLATPMGTRRSDDGDGTADEKAAVVSAFRYAGKQAITGVAGIGAGTIIGFLVNEWLARHSATPTSPSPPPPITNRPNPTPERIDGVAVTPAQAALFHRELGWCVRKEFDLFMRRTLDRQRGMLDHMGILWDGRRSVLPPALYDYWTDECGTKLAGRLRAGTLRPSIPSYSPERVRRQGISGGSGPARSSFSVTAARMGKQLSSAFQSWSRKARFWNPLAEKEAGQWKTFRFFDVSQVKLLDEGESASAFERHDISCVCSGSENVFLGTVDGVVRILSQKFKLVRLFQAHETGSITHMKQVEGTSLLVTVAEDLSSEPILKVWALDRIEKKTGIPSCLSTLSIHNAHKQFPVSAFAVLDDLSQLAVGFANGSVTVIRGDLINDRGAKQRTVFESEEPITGVGFREGGKVTTLYVSTTGRILTLVISGKGQGQPARTVEETGCAVDCMTIDRRNGDIIVARDDAVYYYRPPGRGPCYAYEGSKKLVGIYKNYILLLSTLRTSSATKPSAGYGGSQADDPFNLLTLTLLDTDLKLIAYSESLPSQVKAWFVEWGDLFLLTLDGKLYRYHEKDLREELEILFQRNLYVLALSLAQRAGLDTLQQNSIYRRFGDYLYQKGDLDGAMQQYIKAIDNTEPSQVIRKFLDTQQIRHLVEYLEELHEHHKANADHTTLLLNCYAKLKDIDKLEKFIKSPGDLKFDLETAISMCRQGGYYSQAVYLATKHEEHDLVVTIFVEDSKDYSQALDYIWLMKPEVAYRNLMKYAHVFLEHCPGDTTQLFIDYYNGSYKPKRKVLEVAPSATQSSGMSTIHNLAAFLPLPYASSSQLATPATPNDRKTSVPQLNGGELSGTDPLPYDIPKPRTAFSSFVDHPKEFITFLEACLAHEAVSPEEKVDLYTTLFEIYLHFATEAKGEARDQWYAKAKTLVPIDTSNILLLSHLLDFREGTILVREKQGLRFDIFRSYTSAKDTAGAIKALRKYGSDEPELYPAALTYFTSSPRILEEAGDELAAVLKKIEETGLMAPLQVVQILSTTPVATMALVKQYLSDIIERERKEISNVRSASVIVQREPS